MLESLCSKFSSELFSLSGIFHDKSLILEKPCGEKRSSFANPILPTLKLCLRNSTPASWSARPKLTNFALVSFQHTNDFPLYTEAIKFFNHSESMVRIAVRTLTLNVYRIDEESMLKFVIDKTAVPYFSNLVWFIGNHILDMDACVRNDVE